MSPCRCSGSLQYIHEDCLKTWLRCKGRGLESSQCEICKEPFLMALKVTRKCAPTESFKVGLGQWLLLPLLLTVLGMLILIVYLLLSKVLAEPQTSKETGYTVALLLTCSVSATIILGLIVHSVKEACVSADIKSWTIHNFKE